tara:strand:- start:3620 stop:4021 length:402 start_codon:yes stop_codon:yes gene_type:complete
MFEEILNLNANFTSIIRKISRKHNITLSQALILLNISLRGTSMSGLANRLGLDPSTVTRNIEKLELRNLLYREKSITDTRVINVYKSNEGNRISDSIEQKAESILNQFSYDAPSIKDALQMMNWNMEKEERLK